MKIRPVILCGGAGTRLWPESKNNCAKQFINFGGWCLFEKSLDRIKAPFFDYPIISSNSKYLKKIKYYLKKLHIKKYKIILEPEKKNTGPAILSACIANLMDKKNINYINEIDKPMLILSSDHLIEKKKLFHSFIKKNISHLSADNIFIFGIKPDYPSDQFGYFFTKKINNIYKVTKFIEKPSISKAKKIINKKGYWNTGMFFLTSRSLINNFAMYSPKTYNQVIQIFNKKSKTMNKKKNIFTIDRNLFKKIKSQSIDYAIIEKSPKINAIKLKIPWSDLGSWKEISKMFNKNKKSLYKKNNIYQRPWGKYINLFRGEGFLVKEIYVNPKASLSLQKHHYRSEHWLLTEGKAIITVNKKIFTKKINECVVIPKGAIHRIQNPYNKLVKIIEVQLGSVLKESDIVRYKDIYGRAR